MGIPVLVKQVSTVPMAALRSIPPRLPDGHQD